MKKINKMSLVSFLFIMNFLCIFFFQNTNFVEAAESITAKQFKIEFEYGLNGTVKDECDMPVSVQITNTGNDFEGILQISSNESSNAVSYEFDIKIAKGETQSFQMTIRYFSNDFGFKILDSNGKSIVVQNIETDYSYKNYYVGILSDNASSLKYFKPIELEKSIMLSDWSILSYIVNLEKEDIPTVSSELSCLSFLVIDSFDTSQLSTEQCQAIQNWVFDGGVLIIGTGTDANTTLSAFKDESKFDKDFLNVTVNGTVEGELIVLTDEEKEGTDTISFVKEDNVQSISIEGGKNSNNTNFEDSYFSFDEQLSFIQKKEFGKGAVLVTGFNFSSEVITSLKWKKKLGEAVLSDALTSKAIEDISSYFLKYSGIDSTAHSLLNQLFDLVVPNLIPYVICFLVFVVGIGPVGYLILKKIKKANWMWVSIPIGTIVIIIVLSILSMPARIDKPVASNFTILDVNDNNTATQTTYMGISLSYIDKYEIQLQPEYNTPFEKTGTSKKYGVTLYIPEIGDIYDMFFDDKYVSRVSNLYIRNKGEGHQLQINTLYRFTTNYLKFDNYDKIENCSFDIQITDATTTQFAGSVTNNTGYDMIESFICYGSLAIYIGDFANGETKTFTAEDCIPLPEFSSGTLSKYMKTSDPILKEKVVTAYRMISKSSVYYSSNPIVINDLDYNEGIVCGYIPELTQDIIANQEIDEIGVGVISKRFQLEPSDMEQLEGNYISNLISFAHNYTEDIDYSTYLMASPTAEVVCTVPLETISKIVKSDSSPFGDNSDNIIVFAFNYKTNHYEQLFTDGSNEMTFTDVCPYLNQNPDTLEGNMKLQLKCANYVDGEEYVSGNDYAPKISLYGE